MSQLRPGLWHRRAVWDDPGGSRLLTESAWQATVRPALTSSFSPCPTAVGPSNPEDHAWPRRASQIVDRRLVAQRLAFRSGDHLGGGGSSRGRRPSLQALRRYRPDVLRECGGV